MTCKPWASEWLHTVSQCRQVAEREQAMLEYRRDRAMSYGSQVPSEGGHSGHGPRNGIYEDVTEWVAAQEDASESAKAACAAVNEARDVLDGMGKTGPEHAKAAQVLTMIYVDGMKRQTVANVIGVSRNTIHRIADEGIDMLDAMGPVRARAGVGAAEG